VGKALKPVRGSKKKGVKRRDSRVKSVAGHDSLEPELAPYARAVAIWRSDDAETEPHPLFPAHGQEGSGDYFSQIEKAATAAKKAPEDLHWSLFARGSPSLKTTLGSGYLFFPEPMKRYATGLTEWEREKDAPRSPWCFLLALRGAMLFRGSIRRLRWGRRNYAAFPFVFEGSTVELGAGKYFRNIELYLPTWTAEQPRTLSEFEMQVRQFQARLSARGFAATGAEFRAAVVGRGAGAAFETFHRFVLEGRRPGQRQPMRQGIPRGVTRVGGGGEASGKLRLMLAPPAETRWFDQFIGLPQNHRDKENRLRAARARAEEAIHRAVDEPGLEAYCGVLEALWNLNRSIILPGALRRDLEKAGRVPRPLPPLPARLWEEALRDGLEKNPAYRLGRAIGSICGVRPKGDSAGVGPVLEHMLPVQYDWEQKTWTVLDQQEESLGWGKKRRVRFRPLRWAGLDPLGDLRALLWLRWLDSAETDRLPFAGARYAFFDDIAALLRGEVDIREVHRLAGLFALLDWQDQKPADGHKGSCDAPTIPPAYAALRLWLELGIRPAPDARPPRDGQVVRLLTIGEPEQVQRAAALALSRLRVDGLPWPKDPRPTGKAVARFDVSISSQEARLLAPTLLVPIAEQDKLILSRRLWVPISEEEVDKV
jgi:CRISPR-associated protein Csx17